MGLNQNNLAYVAPTATVLKCEVGSAKVKAASEQRRTTDPAFSCGLCGTTFTKKHNLDSEFLSSLHERYTN